MQVFNCDDDVEEVGLRAGGGIGGCGGGGGQGLEVPGGDVG